MRAVVPALVRFFSNRPAQWASVDFFEFVLTNGTALRFCTYPGGIRIDGQTWLGDDVQFGNSGGAKGAAAAVKPSWKCSLGGTPNELKLTAIYWPDGSGQQSLIDGAVPWPAAIRQGYFDNATFRMLTGFWAKPADIVAGLPPIGRGSPDQFNQIFSGLVNVFQGFVSTISNASRIAAEFSIKDGRILLDQDFPRNVFQASCIHTLFDSGCTLSASSFAVTGTMGATRPNGFDLASGQPDGYFALGRLVYVDPISSVSLSLAVGASTGSQIFTVAPLPSVPPPGTAFTLYPGCSKDTATCKNKFNNLPHFQGFPFVPPPRTTI